MSAIKNIVNSKDSLQAHVHNISQVLYNNVRWDYVQLFQLQVISELGLTRIICSSHSRKYAHQSKFLLLTVHSAIFLSVCVIKILYLPCMSTVHVIWLELTMHILVLNFKKCVIYTALNTVLYTHASKFLYPLLWRERECKWNDNVVQTWPICFWSL